MTTANLRQRASKLNAARGRMRTTKNLRSTSGKWVPVLGRNACDLLHRTEVRRMILAGQLLTATLARLTPDLPPHSANHPASREGPPPLYSTLSMTSCRRRQPKDPDRRSSRTQCDKSKLVLETGDQGGRSFPKTGRGIPRTGEETHGMEPNTIVAQARSKGETLGHGGADGVEPSALGKPSRSHHEAQ
jgi:hypothetical protein